MPTSKSTVQLLSQHDPEIKIGPRDVEVILIPAASGSHIVASVRNGVLSVEEIVETETQQFRPL